MLENIRHTLPAQVQQMLLPDEEVYFYATGGGCLSSRGYLLVSDSRVTGVGMTDRRRSTQCAIPLEHVSAVRVNADGCFSSTKSVWITSSGGAGTGTRFQVKADEAQRAANIVQMALQQRRR
jgi:sugar lactone lactonase YvrE